MKRILVLTVFSLCFMAFSVPKKIAKKADKVIAKFYETDDFTKKPIVISEEANQDTPSHFGTDNFFVIESEGNFLGYGYIGNAPSKTATYDYLVLFDKDFIVAKSKVLIYREEYGGEIGSKRWLKQFNGKPAGHSELKYEKDIIPISGATISVRSMTKAMNDLLKSLGTLQELNAL
ncbi:FMN-binding protein [Aureisphaera galaxeae]|uniref:FMN-binding protein n=1 Tax=Aureisphaera galaxeae TaxID=1538023 RepID=UPI00234FC670|nr:FMN-binding protein [Aureisphaera galaxeae]MDC8006353.1 FMN-binding protein [Aureisphaera galaxeae]